jgi:hypothetical protein
MNAWSELVVVIEILGAMLQEACLKKGYFSGYLHPTYFVK